MILAERVPWRQNRRMTNSVLSPIRVVVSSTLLLSLTACGSNSANTWTEADASPDADTANSTIPDAGSCVWPASFTSSGDASSVGCWAKPTHNICKVPNGGSYNAQDGTIRGPDGQVVTDACQDACSASEYALTCMGDVMMPASMPSPDTSLGCTAIPVPTPSNVLFYCCPCVPH